VDFLVVGFVQDIKENASKIAQIQAVNPEAKLVVVSEEPLWDTLWSGDFWHKHNRVIVGPYEFEYINLNHTTCSLYEFNRFPYFITTSDSFFVRYAYFFNRNSQLTKKQILRIWKDADIQAGFFVEKRMGPEYAADYQQYGAYGLTNLRSEVAETCNIDGALKVGQGWSEGTRRQLLPDWHLDKLVRLDKNSRLVGALENTCQAHYITEKIFDAFAVVGIPIYSADESHSIHKIVGSGSFINLHGYDAAKACKKLQGFKTDATFLNCYMAAINKLNSLFATPITYLDERKRFASKLVAEFENI